MHEQRSDGVIDLADELSACRRRAGVIDLGDELAARRHDRGQERVMHLARQLHLSAIYMELPAFSKGRSPAGAIVSRLNGEYRFVASPRLTALQVKLAAWGLALLVTNDELPDDGATSEGLRFTALARIERSLLKACRRRAGWRKDAHAYVDWIFFGLEPSRAAQS
jgi:hypothetical protein